MSPIVNSTHLKGNLFKVFVQADAKWQQLCSVIVARGLHIYGNEIQKPL